MNTDARILDNLIETRLSALEDAHIAARIASDMGVLSRVLSNVFASFENRMIERVLISRLKTALKTGGRLEESGLLVSEMRGAYAAGTMETLPSMIPSKWRSGKIDLPEGKGPEHLGDNRPIILYVSGGGFIFPPSRKQKVMLQRLSEATDSEVVIGVHRLSPEHLFPTPCEDIAEQYEAMLADGHHPSRIFLGADTAGASLVMGAAQLLRDRGINLPAGIILFSPWCDLSLSGWSYITSSITAKSPFRMETAAFCARLYLGNAAPTDPLASAIFADLTGFPPILLHTSENDLHFDDAVRLAECARRDRCSIKLNYWDSPRHHLERLNNADTKASFAEVSRFIDEHWHLN